MSRSVGTSQQKRKLPFSNSICLRSSLFPRFASSTICTPTSSTLAQGLFPERSLGLQTSRSSKSQAQLQLQQIAKLEAKLQQKDSVLAELMEEYVLLKKSLGSLTGLWVPQSIRDSVVDFVDLWSDRTEFPVALLLGWLGLSKSKFHD